MSYKNEAPRHDQSLQSIELGVSIGLISLAGLSIVMSFIGRVRDFSCADCKSARNL